jgi:hypothetical protein
MSFCFALCSLRLQNIDDELELRRLLLRSSAGLAPFRISLCIAHLVSGVIYHGVRAKEKCDYIGKATDLDCGQPTTFS